MPRNSMSDQDAFERILASLYDAMLDDAEWPATSALIDEACGTVGNALMVAEGPPDDIRALTSSGCTAEGSATKPWNASGSKCTTPSTNPCRGSSQLPDSQMVFTPDLYTAEELKTSPAYNEGLRRLHGQQSLMVRLVLPTGGHIAWASGDPVGSGGWAAPQLALLQGAPAPYPPICPRPAGVGQRRGAGHGL